MAHSAGPTRGAMEGSNDVASTLLGRPAPAVELEFTARVVVVGSLFAVINAVVNMFFAFRYAGGLQQYWVILAAYPICKATEICFPRGSLLNPGPFSPKEHCLVMTMAIAGSLAGSLGLSGGMLSLILDFDTSLSDAQSAASSLKPSPALCAQRPSHLCLPACSARPPPLHTCRTVFSWALIAGFFGVFFGTFFFESLVLPDCYDWPFSRANAAFIGAFYQALENDGGVGRSLKVFGAFFGVAFCWFIAPNYFVPTLLTMPMLCWGANDWRPVLPFGRGGIADLRAVLSSGVAGAGVPGLGGWASSWAFGPSIIPLSTTVQIVVGVILTNWVFVPVAFFSGLAAWPSSFQEFDSDGKFYNATVMNHSIGGASRTEGHFTETAEPVNLSAVGMTMYIGVALSILGMITDVSIQALQSFRAQRIAAAMERVTPAMDALIAQSWSEGLHTATRGSSFADRSAHTATRGSSFADRSAAASSCSLRDADAGAVCDENGAAMWPAAPSGSAVPSASGAGPAGQSVSNRAIPPESTRDRTRERPLSMRTNSIITVALAVLAVCVIELMLPKYEGKAGLGMPLWGTIVAILYALAAAYGCAGIYATTGQTFSGGACILAQVMHAMA